ncbi:hypothetical protein EBT31_22190 [bacterium]|jgi:hypothetical protein|nr:hypothetical protein [bacterium]
MPGQKSKDHEDPPVEDVELVVHEDDDDDVDIPELEDIDEDEDEEGGEQHGSEEEEEEDGLDFGFHDPFAAYLLTSEGESLPDVLKNIHVTLTALVDVLDKQSRILFKISKKFQ